MKKMLGAAIVLALGISAPALAFHEGGVANCNGCHTMHNSVGGVAVAKTPQFQAPAYLLKGTDQSSTCLNCHASTTTASTRYYVMTKGGAALINPQVNGSTYLPVQKTPGGDFGWLYNSYEWSPRSGATSRSIGDRHGHNVIAADFGLTEDVLMKSKGGAPGSGYPTANLACSSCHDPHGKYRRLEDGTFADGKSGASLPIETTGSYDDSPDPSTHYAVGSYRLLAGAGYQPKSVTGSYAFANSPPDAVVKRAYNDYNAKPAYGRNMSEWCANCHGAILQSGYTSGMAGLKHPAGNASKITPAIAANYNTYVKTGDLSATTAGGLATLIPYEEGIADSTVASYATLKTAALSDPTTGTVSASNNVQCLSCHRAHASAFTSMLRWSLDFEFVTYGDSGGVPSYGSMTSAPFGEEQGIAQGKTDAESQAAYYGRPASSFAPFQRVLCNKCHAKD